jgi:hypothetical protein
LIKEREDKFKTRRVDRDVDHVVLILCEDDRAFCDEHRSTLLHYDALKHAPPRMRLARDARVEALFRDTLPEKPIRAHMRRVQALGLRLRVAVKHVTHDLSTALRDVDNQLKRTHSDPS